MSNRPIIDLLTSQKFPKIAQALRARSTVIVARWDEVIRDVLPHADQLTLKQLRDDIPAVLEKTARSLESDRPSLSEALVEAAPKHGVVRFHQSFSLAEVLVEYNILRAIALEEVVTQLGCMVEADEMVALNGAMDISGRQATLAYVQHQSHQLQAATEAQSKYLSFLSHDLRGGLNGVFLMIEVLKRELSAEPQLKETVNDLDVMRRSLMDTVGTMDRFLHAERFRKGKVQLKPSKIRIGPLINEFIAHFTYQAKDKGLKLRADAPVDCEITSDRELLSLIFQNLLSNAVKYAERGTVEVIAKATDNGGCVIVVRDQGPGIPADRLDELFAPFTRGDTHGKPGVGLGLSIARQAAEFIGARLWAESVPQEGSTFHVQLPPDLPAKR